MANLKPKRTKFRKQQKGSMRGVAQSGQFVEFGAMGLQALERGYVSSEQLESMRIAIAKHMNREVTVLFRLFPDKPLTGKPPQTRMGKGKGSVYSWVVPVIPGKVILEIVGSKNEEKMTEALRKAACKLSIKTRKVNPVEAV